MADVGVNTVEVYIQVSKFDSDTNAGTADAFRVHAQVKWFNAEKGFGFVTPMDGSPDAFLHVSVLHAAGLGDLREGAEMQCEIGRGPKGPQVLRVFEVNGAASANSEANRQNDDPIAGTVKWFKPDKGFGFVMADDGGKDVFIHKSVLKRHGLPDLEAGQRVKMTVDVVAKGREATWIAML